MPTKYDTLWCKGFKEIQVLEAFFIACHFYLIFGYIGQIGGFHQFAVMIYVRITSRFPSLRHEDTKTEKTRAKLLY